MSEETDKFVDDLIELREDAGLPLWTGANVKALRKAIADACLKHDAECVANPEYKAAYDKFNREWDERQ